MAGEIKPGKTADVDLGRRAQARELLARARARWQYLLGAMDTPVHAARADLEVPGALHLPSRRELEQQRARKDARALAKGTGTKRKEKVDTPK